MYALRTKWSNTKWPNVKSVKQKSPQRNWKPNTSFTKRLQMFRALVKGCRCGSINTKAAYINADTSNMFHVNPRKLTHFHTTVIFSRFDTSLPPFFSWVLVHWHNPTAVSQLLLSSESTSFAISELSQLMEKIALLITISWPLWVQVLHY